MTRQCLLVVHASFVVQHVGDVHHLTWGWRSHVEDGNGSNALEIDRVYRLVCVKFVRAPAIDAYVPKFSVENSSEGEVVSLAAGEVGS